MNSIAENNVVADILSRAPLCNDEETLALEDLISASPTFRLGVMRVVSDEGERRTIFESCHKITQGHHGVKHTLNEIEARAYKWGVMSRDVTR